MNFEKYKFIVPQVIIYRFLKNDVDAYKFFITYLEFTFAFSFSMIKY